LENQDHGLVETEDGQATIKPPTKARQIKKKRCGQMKQNKETRKESIGRREKSRITESIKGDAIVPYHSRPI
jgi:hypothetical protein